jgi:IS5 family transposase
MPTRFYPSKTTGEQLFLRKLSEELDKKNPLYRLRDLLCDKRLQEIADLCSKEASTGRPKHHDLIMLKLFIIQAMYGMTDSVVAEFFRENMYFQYFCGFETVDTSYKISESCIRRFRQKLGEEGMTSLIEYAIQVAVAHDIIKKKTSRELYSIQPSKKKTLPTRQTSLF